MTFAQLKKLNKEDRESAEFWISETYDDLGDDIREMLVSAFTAGCEDERERVKAESERKSKPTRLVVAAA